MPRTFSVLRSLLQHPFFFGSFNVFMCLETMESGNKIKSSKLCILIMRDTADDNSITDILMLTSTSRYKANSNPTLSYQNYNSISRHEAKKQEHAHFLLLFCAGKRVCVYTLTSLSGLSCSSVVLLW